LSTEESKLCGIALDTAAFVRHVPDFADFAIPQGKDLTLSSQRAAEDVEKSRTRLPNLGRPALTFAAVPALLAVVARDDYSRMAHFEGGCYDSAAPGIAAG
jgi:hypothetical protein